MILFYFSFCFILFSLHMNELFYVLSACTFFRLVCILMYHSLYISWFLFFLFIFFLFLFFLSCELFLSLIKVPIYHLIIFS